MVNDLSNDVLRKLYKEECNYTAAMQAAQTGQRS